jgi:hypothetical protein
MPTPSIHFNGELWLTTNWFMSAGLSQYILSVPNPYANSSPSPLSISAAKTSLQLGYNFLLQEDFFGPKFQTFFGLSQFSSTIDTSLPTAFTSMNFSGIALGIGGSLPVAEEVPLTMGARLTYFLNPTVGESPVKSGESASASMTNFSVYGSYRYTEHMNLKAELVYDLFSASFSGQGSRSDIATSASHSLTTLAAGVEYLF